MLDGAHGERAVGAFAGEQPLLRFESPHIRPERKERDVGKQGVSIVSVRSVLPELLRRSTGR
jgi:hypothetical protein